VHARSIRASTLACLVLTAATLGAGTHVAGQPECVSETVGPLFGYACADANPDGPAASAGICSAAIGAGRETSLPCVEYGAMPCGHATPEAASQRCDVHPPKGGGLTDAWLDTWGDVMFGPLDMQAHPLLLNGYGLSADGDGVLTWNGLAVATCVPLQLPGDGGTVLDGCASALAAGLLPGTYVAQLSFTNPQNAFVGDGSGLSGLDASAIASGTLPGPRLAGTYGETLAFPNAGNSFAGAFDGSFAGTFTGAADGSFAGTFAGAADGSFTGTFTGAADGSFVGTFSGDGSGLADVTASSVAPGSVTAAGIGEPCPAGYVLKRIDGAWQCDRPQDVVARQTKESSPLTSACAILEKAVLQVPIPTAGTVVVRGIAAVALQHTSGQRDELRLSPIKLPGTAPGCLQALADNSPSAVSRHTVPAGLPSANDYEATLPLHATFEVEPSGAGSVLSIGLAAWMREGGDGLGLDKVLSYSFDATFAPE